MVSREERILLLQQIVNAQQPREITHREYFDPFVGMHSQEMPVISNKIVDTCFDRSPKYGIVIWV